MGLAYIKQRSSTSLIGLWLMEESLDELTREWNFTENQLIAYASRVTEKRKKEWLATRLLLKLLLDSEQEIYYTLEGKPCITDGPSISISHSEHYLAILLDSSKNTGIDIQRISKKLTKAKDYFLQAAEIQQLTNPDDAIELTVYWGAKEAVFKYIGLASTNLKDDVTVKPFRLSGEGLITALITNQTNTEEIVLRYTHFDDYIMVCTT
jgi:4'-phosphopantetheinyl transferase